MKNLLLISIVFFFCSCNSKSLDQDILELENRELKELMLHNNTILKIFKNSIKDSLYNHVNQTMQIMYAKKPEVLYKTDSLKLEEYLPYKIYDFKGWGTNIINNQNFRFSFLGTISINKNSQHLEVSKISINRLEE